MGAMIILFGTFAIAMGLTMIVEFIDKEDD